MRGHTIPSWHTRHFQSPAVIPDIVNPPSVIPDIVNRESMTFPMQAHTNKRKGTEEKNTGFPLTTGGNDRGGAGGHDKGAPVSLSPCGRVPG